MQGEGRALSICCLCSEQAQPRIEVIAFYFQIKFHTEIPIALVPRLNKG